MINILQVKSHFADPYNSSDIGLFRVSELKLGSNFACSPEDVHSKCIVLSDGIKRESLHGDEPDVTNLDPMPAEVLRLLRGKKSAGSSIQAAYEVAFPDGIPTWTIHSFLRPGCDY
jgi:hypothetical protein